MEILTLEQAYYVGELIAAFAVIVSLLYVGRQMKQNTEAIQIGAAQEFVQMFNTFTADLGNSEEMALIWYQGTQDYNNLDKASTIRFHAMVAQWMRIMESIYQQWKRGAVDSDTWEGVTSLQRDTVIMPGIIEWEKVRGHWHGPEFRGWIESLRQSSNAKSLYQHLENKE
jgi:hypothetical protein